MKEEFEVRDETAEKVLKDIGNLLRDVMPPGYGFSLMVFNFGPNSNMFYVSSAERSQMIAMMRKFIQKFEAN